MIKIIFETVPIGLQPLSSQMQRSGLAAVCLAVVIELFKLKAGYCARRGKVSSAASRALRPPRRTKLRQLGTPPRLLCRASAPPWLGLPAQVRFDLEHRRRRPLADGAHGHHLQGSPVCSMPCYGMGAVVIAPGRCGPVSKGTAAWGAKRLPKKSRGRKAS